MNWRLPQSSEKLAFQVWEQEIRDTLSMGNVEGFCWVLWLHSFSGVQANYHRWVFDPRKKRRPGGTSLWPPGDPSEVRSRQSESCLVYNDSPTGFYVDEQHDLQHQGHQRGHFLMQLEMWAESKRDFKPTRSTTALSNIIRCLLSYNSAYLCMNGTCISHF